jgi:hypothetical protein
MTYQQGADGMTGSINAMRARYGSRLRGLFIF